VPRAVTADRGYGQPAVERDLPALGVRTVAIPGQATTSAARKNIEHSRGFHRLVKWRTGSGGRISYLKRSYGWDRTRQDGRQGAAIWCGHGVFAHNLAKIGALASYQEGPGPSADLVQLATQSPLLRRALFRLK
jgi:transposase, IS5 family